MWLAVQPQLSHSQRMDSFAFQLSGHACVAARGLLNISQQELASLAGISLSSLRRLEQGEKVSPYVNDRVLHALQKQGIRFVSGSTAPELTSNTAPV